MQLYETFSLMTCVTVCTASCVYIVNWNSYAGAKNHKILTLPSARASPSFPPSTGKRTDTRMGTGTLVPTDTWSSSAYARVSRIPYCKSLACTRGGHTLSEAKTLVRVFNNSCETKNSCNKLVAGPGDGVALPSSRERLDVVVAFDGVAQLPLDLLVQHLFHL